MISSSGTGLSAMAGRQDDLEVVAVDLNTIAHLQLICYYLQDLRQVRHAAILTVHFPAYGCPGNRHDLDVPSHCLIQILKTGSRGSGVID